MKDFMKTLKNVDLVNRLSLIGGLFFLVQAIIIAMIGIFILVSTNLSGPATIFAGASESNFLQVAAMSCVFSFAFGGPGFLSWYRPISRE